MSMNYTEMGGGETESYIKSKQFLFPVEKLVVEIILVIQNIGRLEHRAAEAYIGGMIFKIMHGGGDCWQK